MQRLSFGYIILLVGSGLFRLACKDDKINSHPEDQQQRSMINTRLGNDRDLERESFNDILLSEDSTPSSSPSCQPSEQPTSQPSTPSSQPSIHPTSQPSDEPTSQPSTP